MCRGWNRTRIRVGEQRSEARREPRLRRGEAPTKLETALSLVSAIGDASNLALDAENKITALMRVLSRGDQCCHAKRK